MTRPFAQELDLRGLPGLTERFWSKVDTGAPDECWEWTAHRKASGYGQFTITKGVFSTASRVALALASGGVLPAGVVACHACDNPPCCNPAHLFPGSQVDNAMDSVRKGRALRSRGVNHLHAKLTPEAVRAIRSTPIRHGVKSQLAREYGVSLTAIRSVLAGKTWADVEGMTGRERANLRRRKAS